LTSFERELRSRTAVKSSPHLSEEAVLVRGFKYFDLTDQGRVNKRNFIQAVKGLGVVNFAEDVVLC
jgi:Ca2+-binding EF-hand superfamily protein